MDSSEISALIDRTSSVMSRVASLDTVMRSLHAASLREQDSLAALGGEGASGAGTANGESLTALRTDIADLGRLVREEFEQYEQSLALVGAALAALSAAVSAQGTARTAATDRLSAELQSLSGRLSAHEDLVETATAGATAEIHELTESIGADRAATREHVAALHSGTQEAASTGAHAGERSRRHSEEVAQALHDELGAVGQGLALVAERLQQGVERAVDEQIHAVVREAVRRIRQMFHELLGRMEHAQGDLRGVRDLLSSLFARLESLIGEVSTEAETVTAHQESLEAQLQQHESEQDDHHD